MRYISIRSWNIQWTRKVVAVDTLGLHAGADQGEGVAGELSTGTGHGATAQQHQHTRVRAVGAVLQQPAVLKGLREHPS